MVVVFEGVIDVPNLQRRREGLLLWPRWYGPTELYEGDPGTTDGNPYACSIFIRSLGAISQWVVPRYACGLTPQELPRDYDKTCGHMGLDH